MGSIFRVFSRIQSLGLYQMFVRKMYDRGKSVICHGIACSTQWNTYAMQYERLKFSIIDNIYPNHKQFLGFCLQQTFTALINTNRFSSNISFQNASIYNIKKWWNTSSSLSNPRHRITFLSFRPRREHVPFVAFPSLFCGATSSLYILQAQHQHDTSSLLKYHIIRKALTGVPTHLKGESNPTSCT